MATPRPSLREHLFSSHISARLAVARPSRPVASTDLELRIYCLASVLFVGLAFYLTWHLENVKEPGTQAHQAPTVFSLRKASPINPTIPAGPKTEESKAIANVEKKPVVPDEYWKQLEITDAPELLTRLSQNAVPFTYRGNVPVARIDGADLHNRLPDVLWVKVEQPGNAVLMVEATDGVYIRMLEEVSPGFVSRCRITSEGFGTMEGKAAEIDAATLEVKAVWVIQDAATQPGHVPGWVSITPRPDNSWNRRSDSEENLANLLRF